MRTGTGRLRLDGQDVAQADRAGPALPARGPDADVPTLVRCVLDVQQLGAVDVDPDVLAAIADHDPVRRARVDDGARNPVCEVLSVAPIILPDRHPHLALGEVDEQVVPVITGRFLW